MAASSQALADGEQAQSGTESNGTDPEVADTVVSMDGGVIVESGPPAQVLGDPQHERTQAFLSNVM